MSHELRYAACTQSWPCRASASKSRHVFRTGCWAISRIFDERQTTDGTLSTISSICPKLEGGRMRFESEPIDLGKIVADVVLNFKRSPKSGTFTLLPRAPALASPTAMIQGDAVPESPNSPQPYLERLEIPVKPAVGSQVSVTETPPTGRDRPHLFDWPWMTMAGVPRRRARGDLRSSFKARDQPPAPAVRVSGCRFAARSPEPTRARSGRSTARPPARASLRPFRPRRP